MNTVNIDGNLLKKAFEGAAQFLDEYKQEVNELNVFPVPDGDTGTNMSLTMRSAVKKILELEEYSVEKVALAASTGSLMGARGNSGVILSQIFRGFYNGLKDKEFANTTDLALAFKLAADTSYKAVMKPTEGTILTVARCCGEYAIELAKDEKDIIIFLEKVIIHGNKVLDKTPDMLPILKDAGVVDAGGKGLMCVLTGAYNAITLKSEITYDYSDIGQKSLTRHRADEEIEFAYCTELMIHTGTEHYEELREDLKAFGDSLMVVDGEGLIKVHVHTNNPGEVLEEALKLGELNDIKIDNMRYQHSHILENKKYTEEKNKEKPLKKYGFITVSIGEGINTVFNELNVDYIIPGGQTMNPSTEDIMNAISKINAENIIVFPNNGNIILAADQAKELSEKNVHVFPTKTIPEGITALLTFDPELDVEENLKNMEEEVANVKTAQVTYAVRDTKINDKVIKKDDIMGVSMGEIVSTGDNVEEVSFDVIEKLVDEDSSLITIFYGNGIEEVEALNLSKKIEEKFNDFDIEVVFGGQPLYYYVFSIE